MTDTKTRSRYGESRVVFRDGADFIVEGAAHYYRVGMNADDTAIAYFDPEGGPFIAVGAVEPEFENRTITGLVVESAPSGRFRVRVQVAA